MPAAASSRFAPSYTCLCALPTLPYPPTSAFRPLHVTHARLRALVAAQRTSQHTRPLPVRIRPKKKNAKCHFIQPFTVPTPPQPVRTPSTVHCANSRALPSLLVAPPLVRAVSHPAVMPSPPFHAPSHPLALICASSPVCAPIRHLPVRVCATHLLATPSVHGYALFNVTVLI